MAIAVNKKILKTQIENIEAELYDILTNKKIIDNISYLNDLLSVRAKLKTFDI